MGIFRSEKMICKKICFPQEFNDQVFDEIGKIENGLEIIDHNVNTLESKREFYNAVNRCKQIEKKIAKIEKIFGDFSFKIKNYEKITEFYQDYEDHKNFLNLNNNTFFDYAENQIKEDENKLEDLISYKNDLINEIIIKHEKFHTFKLLFNTIENIGKKSVSQNHASGSNMNDYSIFEENNLNQRLLEGALYEDSGFYLCGVIKSEDKLRFQRVVFRGVFSRCNFNFFDIPDINKQFINDIENYDVI